MPPLTVTGEGCTSVAWSADCSTKPMVAGWGSPNGRTGSGISLVAAASAGAPTPAGAAGGKPEAAPRPADAGATPGATGTLAPGARITEISAGSAATCSDNAYS